jgi:hypothetical protein
LPTKSGICREKAPDFPVTKRGGREFVSPGCSSPSSYLRADLWLFPSLFLFLKPLQEKAWRYGGVSEDYVEVLAGILNDLYGVGHWI